MIDIKDINVLEKYLAEKGLISNGSDHTITYCKGGVSGTVVYVDRVGKTPMIIKQALAQLKTKETWLCDPNRMGIEYDSNRIYHELMPENAPEVYFYDEENYIYGREAVPDDCQMWKADLMSGLLDFQVAEKSIRTLVTVHNRCAGDEAVRERFGDKEVFYNLRINPYIEFTVNKYPEWNEDARKVISLLMDSGISLVHGDYSPKNIMVTKGRGISVLDYEVAHYGHPAFDLAFFSNHFILKSIRFPEIRDAYLSMLEYMVGIYMREMTFMDRSEMENATLSVLRFLLIARIDGKSPVEYLVGDDEKQQKARNIVKIMFAENISDWKSLFSVLRAN
ncbi:MAG: phosphotransferase [Clostridia bacterium]|nr:phosphotransferase [Clostridia bacterium]